MGTSLPLNEWKFRPRPSFAEQFKPPFCRLKKARFLTEKQKCSDPCRRYARKENRLRLKTKKSPAFAAVPPTKPWRSRDRGNLVVLSRDPLTPIDTLSV